MSQPTRDTLIHFSRKISELLWIPLVLCIGNVMGHGVSAFFLT